MPSDKTPDEIKREYQNTLRKAKVISAITIVPWSFYLYANISDSQTLLGIGKITFLAIASTATIGYTLFWKLAWKCPSCGNFPGGGWSRQSCNSCGVAL